MHTVNTSYIRGVCIVLSFWCCTLQSKEVQAWCSEVLLLLSAGMRMMSPDMSCCPPCWGWKTLKMQREKGLVRVFLWDIWYQSLWMHQGTCSCMYPSTVRTPKPGQGLKRASRWAKWKKSQMRQCLYAWAGNGRLPAEQCVQMQVLCKARWVPGHTPWQSLPSSISFPLHLISCLPAVCLPLQPFPKAALVPRSSQGSQCLVQPQRCWRNGRGHCWM